MKNEVQGIKEVPEVEKHLDSLRVQNCKHQDKMGSMNSGSKDSYLSMADLLM